MFNQVFATRTVVILSVVGAFLTAVQPTAVAGPNNPQPVHDDQLDKLISFASDASIFPESWREAPFHVTAEPVADGQRARARRLVRTAVRKYPAELIRSSLDRIYLLGDLTAYREQKFAGTAHANAVYLVVKPEDEEFSDRFIRRNFHREFSSTLLNRHGDQFPFDRWKDVHDADVHYLGGNSWDGNKSKDEQGGAQAISSGQTSLALTDRTSYLKQGFLTEYSRSSVENDINEYAAHLFDGTSAFWNRVETYDAVRTKCDLAISFYHALHSNLNEAYFRQLAE